MPQKIKTKILLIEDEVNILDIVKDVLKEEGFQVKTASSGKKGVEIASAWLPDLIICDIMMPGMDGYEVFEKLKEQPTTSGIPIIYLTAKADYQDFRKGMNLGAADYIFKPFDIRSLVKAVKVRLDKISAIRSISGDSNA